MAYVEIKSITKSFDEKKVLNQVSFEMMKIQVIKAGTERQQGVAYMDDGTMIVVEDGQYYMNQEIDVIVTSALQTAAGRMIFAKPAHSQKKMNKPQE